MLVVRESDLVQQVSSLERQLNRAPQTEEDPALQTLRDQLQLAAEHSQAFQSQLEQKVYIINYTTCLTFVLLSYVS